MSFFTDLTETVNFKILSLINLKANISFEVEGACRELNLCIEKNINNFECQILDNCSEVNCRKLGVVTCNFEFKPDQVKYGEMQSFYISTLGKSPNSRVNSNTYNQLIELDTVKTNDLRVNASITSIEVLIPETSKPRGSYTHLRIRCLDLELNNADGEVISTIFTNCNKLTCLCDNLWAGSIYSITLQTVKETDNLWKPVDVVLSKNYSTRVIPPFNLRFNEFDWQPTNVTINWNLPNRRFTGFLFEIFSLNLRKFCYVSDSLRPSKRFIDRGEEMCIEKDNTQSSFTWENLNPGEEYQIRVMTFKGSSYGPETYSDVKIIDVLTSN